MKKLICKVICILIFLFFLVSWPVKNGTFNFPLLFMSKIPDYVGSVYFEHITLMNIIKYLLSIFLVIYFIINLNKIGIEKCSNKIFFYLLILYMILTLFFINNIDVFGEKIKLCYNLLVITLLIYFLDNIKLNGAKILKTIAKFNSIALIIQVVINKNLIYSFQDLRIYRFTGLGISPIIVSILISLGILIIIYEKEKFYILKSLIMSLTCFFTGSRTFLLPLGVGIILVSLKNIFKLKDLKYKQIKLKKILLFIIFITSFITSIIIYHRQITIVLEEYYISMFENTSGIGEDSWRNRKRNVAIEYYKLNPIIGNGTNTYPNYQYQIIGSKSNPHNIYLEILCENGIIGLFLLIVFLISIIYKSIKNKNYLQFILIINWCLVSFTLGMLEFSGLLILFIILKIDKSDCDKLL